MNIIQYMFGNFQLLIFYAALLKHITNNILNQNEINWNQMKDFQSFPRHTLGFLSLSIKIDRQPCINA
jgi:hypothetical protein